MTSTFALLLGSLVTVQTYTNDYWPVVSCNKYGTVFDSVWMANYQSNPPSQQIRYERNSYSTFPSEAGGVNLPSYTVGGIVYSGLPQPTAPNPAASIDTDDTSESDPNFAAVFVAQNNYVTSNPTIPFCGVNLKNPFPVGYNASTMTWTQATVAYVAVARQFVPYGTGSAMAVAVAFQSTSGTVFVQVFLVNPATGVPVWSGNPVQANPPGTSGGQTLGGISGDDKGNFAVSYVRTDESKQGVYVSGFNYASSTFGFQDFAVVLGNTGYTWSRVACYHGNNAATQGFVVGYGGLNAKRYTTNWTSNPTLASTNTVNYSGYLPSSQTQTAQIGIACVRDTPGSYMLTWASYFSSAGQNTYQLNVMIGPVVNDTAGGPDWITNYMGSYLVPAPYWAGTPSAALSDGPSVVQNGPLYHVDFYLSAKGTGPRNVTGANTYVYAP